MSAMICPYCGRTVTVTDDGAFARDSTGDTYCAIAGDTRIFPLHGAVPAGSRVS